MDKSQRRSLEKHGPQMVQELKLDADLTTKLIRHRVFNGDMIEEIKSVSTKDDEQIQKMLLQLSKRSSRAFDMFVYSIREHFPWLADNLRKTQQAISQKKGIKQKKTIKITKKEMADILVHEKFGQSKRLSEEDKKEIKQFLYTQLENHSEDGPCYSRRCSIQSIQSDESDNFNQPEEEEANKNKIELLKQLLNILNGQSDTEREDSNDEKVTVEMIEKRVYEQNRKVEDQQNEIKDQQNKIKDQQNEIKDLKNKIKDLQNEIKGCYSVLGLEDCKYTLHEVLETYKENNQSQIAELAEKNQSQVAEQAKFQETVKKLKRQKEDLKAKEKELQKHINNMANQEDKNEKSKAIERLKSECARLERIHSKHLEKEQTLLTLKSMIKDLTPQARESHEHLQPHYGLHKVDGNTLHFPKLSKLHGARSTRISRRSTVRDSSYTTHYEYPQPKSYGSASLWKY